MGVDSSTTLDPNGGVGRKSVRITSKASFTHGLIISDIGHMPGGICGTWPARTYPTRVNLCMCAYDIIDWTLGPNWPSNGEIDIIEGVNNAATNLMSLHTYALIDHADKKKLC